MFCTSCGGRVEDGAAFTKCGRLLRGATAPSSGIQASPRAQLVQSTASTAQQAPWGAALLLQNGESVTRYWYADREIGQMATVNGRRRMVKQRIKGYLVLTTQRLAFVRERGILGKSYHIDLSFPIDKLSGLSMGGLVMKYVSISDSGGEQVFHVSGVGDEPQFASFRALIQEQLAKRQQTIEAEKRRDRTR